MSEGDQIPEFLSDLEVARQKRTYGLIDPANAKYYKQTSPDAELILAFDTRYRNSELTNHHIVYGDKMARLDRRLENGNFVLSIVLEDADHPDNDSEGIWCYSVNLIVGQDGCWLEGHHSKERGGQVIWEPTVGSDEVHIGELVDMDLLQQIAFGTALSEAA